MNGRVTQNTVETIILPTFRNSRISQGVVEVVLNSVVVPAKSRISQNVIEVIMENVAPPVVTRRYGPKVQSV